MLLEGKIFCRTPLPWVGSTSGIEDSKPKHPLADLLEIAFKTENGLGPLEHLKPVASSIVEGTISPFIGLSDFKRVGIFCTSPGAF